MILSLIVGLTSPGVAQDQPPAKKTVHRRIYIPIDELDVLMQRDRKGVLLPNDEFEELYNLAEQNSEETGPGVGDIVLTRANYDARLDGSLLRITATVEFSQFVDDWRGLPLPLGSLAIEQAMLDGEPARIGRAGEQHTLYIVNQSKGKHSLSLELSTETASTGVEKLATLALLPAPAGTLTLHLDAGQHLLVDGLSLNRPAESDQPADYRIPVGGRTELSLHITDRPSEQTTDALVFATTAYGLHVSPGEVTWNTRTSFQVFGQPINRLTFTIPKPLEVADVVSPGLEGWELADSSDGEATVLTLSYRQPIRGERTVQVRGVMTIPTSEPWTVPTLSIENITSHIGRLIVRYPAGVRLQMAETEGTRPAPLDESVPPAEERFSQTLLFDIWRQDFNLQFLTQQKEREVQAAVSTMLTINNTGADLQLAATVESRFAPLFELDMTLPSEFVIREVTMNGTPVKWHIGSSAAGINELRIPLTPSLPADQEANFVLKAHRDLENWPVESDPATFAIPEVTLPQAGVVEGSYVVIADDDLDVTPAEIEGLDPVYLGVRGERLGYRYQDTHFSGQLTVSRKPTRLSAESVIFARLDRETWHAFYQITVSSVGGGTKSLDLTLGENAGTDLRFYIVDHAARIIEQIPSAAKDGLITWTLRFDQRLQGTFKLLVDIERPRSADEELRLSPLIVVGADRQNGYVAWEASEEQQLDIAALDGAGDSLVQVDPLDVPPTNYTPKERIVSVYRFTTPDYAMVAKVQRYERHPVPTAVCYTAGIDSILGETGEWQHRAIYRLAATGVQSLEVQFPKAGEQDLTELWAAIIDQQPIEVRHVGEAYSISLPPASDPTAVRVVELYYRNHTDRLKTFGTLQQELPSLAIVGGSGEPQPLTVLEQTWTVYHPEHVAVIDSDGRFEPVDELETPSWLGRLQTGLTKISVRDVGAKLAVFGVAAFTALVIAAVSGRKRWTKLSWLELAVAVLIIGVLIALMMPAVQSAREAARRPAAGTAMKQYGMALHNYHDADGLPSASYLDSGIDYDFVPSSGEAMVPFSKQRPTSGVISEWPPGEEKAQAPADETPADEPVAGPMAGRPAMPPVPGPEPAVVSENRSAAEKPHLQDGIVQSPGRYILNEDPFAEGEKLARSKDGDADIIDQTITDDVITMPLPSKRGGAWVASPAARASLGGLLSLTIPFHAPDGSVRQTFRYLGDLSTGEAADLEVSYEDRETRDVLRLVVVLLVLVPVWVLKHRSFAVRLAYLLIAVALPLALVPIVPVRWQIFLDGVFIGALWGFVLMFVLACLACCRAGYCNVATFKHAAKLKLWSLWLVGATVVLTAYSAVAQEQQQQAAPPATEVQNGIVAPPDDEIPSDPNAIEIYIPYEPGSDPLAAERVFLPYKTFVKLWNQAHPDQKLLRESPLKALVTQAIYSAKIADAEGSATDVVTVTGRLAIYNLEDRQHVVALPFHNVALRSATLNGEPAAVLAPTAEQPQPRLAVSQRGLNVLDVTFDVPVKLAGAAGQFTLPLDPVASGRLTFQLPAADLNVRINGSKSAYRLHTEEGNTFIDVPIDRGGDVAVSWQPEEERGAVDSTVLTDTSTAVSLTDAGLTVSQGFAYSVRQGSLSELNFTMPEPLRLRRIDGADVGGWEIQGIGDERTLRIFLRRKVTDATSLSIELFHEADVNDEPLDVDLPLCVPTDVTRETGVIALFAGEQLTIRLGSVDGLMQAEVGAFHEVVPLKHPANSPVAVYRYRTPIESLPLSLSRRQPESRVRGEHGLYLTRRKQHLTSKLSYNLTGAPRAVLPVRLPEGYLVLEVSATGMADWSLAPNPDGTGQIMLIELATPQTGNVDVVLSGTVNRDPENNFPALDFPFPFEVNRYQAHVAVWIDDIYITQLGDHFGWKAIAPNELPAELQQRNAQPVQYAFVSVEPDPDLILFELKRAEPSLTADSLTVVTVSETAVTYALALQWKISKAAADTVHFSTPEWLKGKLDFTVGGLRQVTQTDLPDDRVLWTVTLQDAVRDNLFLTAIATLPPSPDDEVLLPAIEFIGTATDAADITPLETQRQYLVTVNQSRSQLAPLDEDLVELITREEVPIVIPDDIARQATQIARLLRPRTAPVIDLQRFERQQAIPASVNLSELTTVLERDGNWRTAAVYRIKNRSRQFLALTIPADARILSVFVQGQAARPVVAERNGKTMHLVALPKISEADLSATVKIVLAGRLINAPLPKGFRLTAKEIDLPAPQVVSTQDDAEYGLPVAKTQWTVYLPDDLEVDPIDDRDRNNLERVDDVDLVLAKEEYLYSEAEQLSQVIVVDSSSSMRSKQQAYENLKRIQKNLDEIESVRGQVTGKADAGKKAEQLEEQRKVLDEVIVSNSALGVQVTPELLGVDAFSYRQLQEQSDQLLSSNGIVGNTLEGTTATGQTPISNFSTELGLMIDQSEEELTAKNEQQQAQSRSLRREQSKQNLDVLRGQQLLEKEHEQIRQNERQAQIEAKARLKEDLSGLQDFSRASGPMAGSGGRGFGMGGMGGGAMGRTDGDSDAYLLFDKNVGDQIATQDGYSRFNIYHPNDTSIDFSAGTAVGFQFGDVKTWTQQGGLSLPIDLPTGGQKLVFSKVTGSPRLALSLRTRETVATGVGLVWTVVWFAAAAVLIVAVVRYADLASMFYRLPEFLIAIGVVGYFLIPRAHTALLALFLIMFVIGVITLAARRRSAKTL